MHRIREKLHREYAARGWLILPCATLVLAAWFAAPPTLAQDERSRPDGASAERPAPGTAEHLEGQIEELRSLLDQVRQMNEEQVRELRELSGISPQYNEITHHMIRVILFLVMVLWMWF